VPRTPWTAATARFLDRREGWNAVGQFEREEEAGSVGDRGVALQGSLGGGEGPDDGGVDLLRLMSGIFERRGGLEFFAISRTFSRVSKSVKLRLRIFSRQDWTRAGDVLKPWRSQGSFLKASSSRILIATDVTTRVWRLLRARRGGSGLPALRRAEKIRSDGI